MSDLSAKIPPMNTECVECGYFLINDPDGGIIELGPECGDCGGDVTTLEYEMENN